MELKSSLNKFLIESEKANQERAKAVELLIKHLEDADKKQLEAAAQLCEDVAKAMKTSEGKDAAYRCAARIRRSAMS